MGHSEGVGGLDGFSCYLSFKDLSVGGRISRNLHTSGGIFDSVTGAVGALGLRGTQSDTLKGLWALQGVERDTE